MPTFKNETGKPINQIVTIHGPHGPKSYWVRFKKDETQGHDFWLPWEELGLTLVDADYPEVPELILTSGTYDFGKGTIRKFIIPPCDRYVMDLIVQAGRVKLYAGNAAVGAEIVKNDTVPFRYRAEYEWEQAPWLRVEGMEDGSRATLHAETGSGKIMDLPCR